MKFKDLKVGDSFIINNLPAKKLKEKDRRTNVYGKPMTTNAQVIDSDYHRDNTPHKYYIYVAPNRKVKLKDKEL